MPVYLYGTSGVTATNHPAGGSTADRVVAGLTALAVDGRVYPMFALLLGYGMAVTALRQRAAGTSHRGVRALLRTRNLLLVAFGAVHATLLFYGDVLGTYGLIGLMTGWLVLRSGRAQLTAAAVAFAVAVALLLTFAHAVIFTVVPPSVLAGYQTAFSDPRVLPALLARAQVWPLITILSIVATTAVAAVVVGIWAGGRRVLDEPQQHAPLLRRTAAIGIPVALAGAAPQALAVAELWTPDTAGILLAAQLSGLTGIAGGLGYAALFGLLALRMRREPGRFVRPLAALGRRSLSGYLAQSVLFAPLLCAWGLGLGATLHSAGAAALAVGAWLVTVALAALLDRAGRRGPAETLLRRLAYRGRTADRVSPDPRAASAGGPPR